MRTSINSTLTNTYNNVNNHIIKMCASIESQIETSRGAEAGEISRSHPRELVRVRTTLAEATSVSLELQQQATPAREEAKKLGWIQ